MSPAQAELEAKDLEIERLQGELAACHRRLVEALGACDLARQTIADLKLDVAQARAETEQVDASWRENILKLKAKVLRVIPRMIERGIGRL